jgi:hypothetical protein
MKFRLLALWPSKDILPAPITCDTACEAMRHHRLLRLSKVGAVTIEAGEGVDMKEITIHRLKRLADAERAAMRRPWHRTRKTVASVLLASVASALGEAGVSTYVADCMVCCL